MTYCGLFSENSFFHKTSFFITKFDPWHFAYVKDYIIHMSALRIGANFDPVEAISDHKSMLNRTISLAN